MFETTALDSVANRYVDKHVPTSTPGTRLEADDRNIIQDELVNAIEDSGQTLDPTGVDRVQLSSAMFLYKYIVDAAEVDQGAAGTGKSVKDFVGFIGTSKSATLVFPHNGVGDTTTYTFSTDETIPSNITVVAEKGAILSIASTKTLTIKGSFAAGHYQVFSGDGSVIFGAGAVVNEAYPEWWTTNTTPGTTDMTTAIQAAIDSIGSTGGVAFISDYLTTAPLVLPTNGFNINLYSKSGSEIKASHNGNCIVTTGADSNQTHHIIEGLIITGPNTLYPAGGYSPPSTGAGLYMATTYHTTVRDCIIQGFEYGVYMQTAIGNTFEGKTYIRFNQYGLYIDGGATNANVFKGVGFRENRKRGINITGTGGPPFPTHNVFNGCLIETNIPYPYVSGGPGDYSDSVGVYLSGTYDNRFINCYSENHEYGVVIVSSSDRNVFTGHRFASGTGRVDKIAFVGSACNQNKFITCYGANVLDETIVQIESDNADQLNNQFLGCDGFNFISTSLLSIPYVQSLTSLYGNTSTEGAYITPPWGHKLNPGEGTNPGLIDGIGTSDATLNAIGYGEITFGDLITDDTVITGITMSKGQYLVLTNYQSLKAVTIKSGASGISSIVLDGLTDCILDDYSETIFLYKTGIGKIIEIGRNTH